MPIDDYAKMSSEDYDRILLTMVNATRGDTLLAIPGVYELVSEEYNNAVLAAWSHEQTELTKILDAVFQGAHKEGDKIEGKEFTLVCTSDPACGISTEWRVMVKGEDVNGFWVLGFGGSHRKEVSALLNPYFVKQTRTQEEADREAAQARLFGEPDPKDVAAHMRRLYP